jgi:hypothetical protein
VDDLIPVERAASLLGKYGSKVANRLGLLKKAPVPASPKRIYSAHDLVGGTNRDLGPNHQFPAMVEKWVFEGEKKVIKPDYVLYTRRGTVNGVQGTYEIGVQPSTSGGVEEIKHRFFRPDPKPKTGLTPDASWRDHR